MYNDDPLRQPGPATPTRSYIPKRWRKKATHARTHTLESDKGKYYLLRVSLFPDHLITLLTYLLCVLCRCFGAPATHARRPHGRVFP